MGPLAAKNWPFDGCPISHHFNTLKLCIGGMHLTVEIMKKGLASVFLGLAFQNFLFPSHFIKPSCYNKFNQSLLDEESISPPLIAFDHGRGKYPVKPFSDHVRILDLDPNDSFSAVVTQKKEGEARIELTRNKFNREYVLLDPPAMLHAFGLDFFDDPNWDVEVGDADTGKPYQVYKIRFTVWKGLPVWPPPQDIKQNLYVMRIREGTSLKRELDPDLLTLIKAYSSHRLNTRKSIASLAQYLSQRAASTLPPTSNGRLASLLDRWSNLPLHNGSPTLVAIKLFQQVISPLADSERLQPFEAMKLLKEAIQYGLIHPKQIIALRSLPQPQQVVPPVSQSAINRYLQSARYDFEETHALRISA